MSKTFFATPQEVEAAFYEAIERADLEAMMQVWCEDEEVVCVHPGGPRLAGYDTIRDAWRRIFNSSPRLRVQVSMLSAISNPFSAVHSLIEFFGIKDDMSQQAPVVATNIYVRGPSGWRMAVHHASPAPPDSIVESPKILH